MNDPPVSRFVALLRQSPPSGGVFNPWIDVDKENDLGPRSPEIRRRQFMHFLKSRRKTARYLIIGEAVGYQGGHFSGIPMTSERILLGFLKEMGVRPGHVLPGLTPRRTSRPDRMANGFNEPTATIVWRTILKSLTEPGAFVLWNTFPWHPYDPAKGILSNRRPRAGEMGDVPGILTAFLDLYPAATVVGMGRVAQDWLTRLGVDHHPVRHPAMGGARTFRTQLLELVGAGKG